MLEVETLARATASQLMLEVETLATATASQLMLEVGILASKPDDAPFLVFCLHQRGEKEENFF